MRRILTAVALIALAAPVGVAQAHIQDSAGVWYFYGVLSEHQGEVAPGTGDPVNIIFYGGAPHGDAACQEMTTVSYNQLCVFNHVTAAFPAMHHSICSKEHLLPGFDTYMGFRDLENGPTQWVQAVHENGQQFYSSPPHGIDPCPAGYHMRLWTDHVHADQTGSAHGQEDQWEIGGIHHERRQGGGKHRLDMDWDDVRVNFYKQMTGRGNGTGTDKFCGDRHWRIDTQAIGKFQKFDNTGMISRISMTSRSLVASCDGE
jgi:hypothetical protein